MSQTNYENQFKKAQETMQEFAQLNMETLKNWQQTVTKPADFDKVTRPEQAWEQQIEWSLDNAQKAVEYLQKSLHIIRSVVSESKNDAKK